jgi:hypothetical protein
VTPDSFVYALQHLDPGSRALLDLSLRRGLDDSEIAELLGADSDYVSHSREAAIAQLAEDLGMHGDPEAVREALLQMPEDAWRRSPEMTSAPADANGNGAAPSVIDNPALAEDEPATKVEPKPKDTPALPSVLTRASIAKPQVSSRLVLMLVLLAAVIVALVLSLSSGGGSSSSPSSSSSTKSTPAPAAKNTPAPKAGSASGKSASLTSLGQAARGTASLDGHRLTLTVTGLPQPTGLYEVWLYNDEIDAVPVTTFHTASATVKAKLPAAASRYRYVDVSLEPQDGNPNHSGDSILRVPLSSLR